MAKPLEPIIRRKLSEEVFDRLKAMIVSGELVPGDAMPAERELMARFGVGRPAVREAMQSLAGMGLIAINHGERARVLALTPESVVQQVNRAAEIMLLTSPEALDHLKEARILFERGVVRQAAERATPADVDALRTLLDLQRAALGTPENFVGADMRFHNRIAAICGNPILSAVSQSMLGWLKQYHTELLLWSGKENVTLAEHAEILEAIAAGKPEAAEAAMVLHLERARGLYVHQTA